MAEESTTENATAEEIIICEDVCKWFGDFQALKDCSLRVQSQEVVVIIGPSGSGKSTFIRCINRLEEHQAGDIIVDGIPLTRDVRQHRADPLRDRHGLSAVQPLPPPDRARKHHPRADPGAQDEEG